MSRAHFLTRHLLVLAMVAPAGPLAARSGSGPAGHAGAPPSFLTCARHHTAPAGPMEITAVSLSTTMGDPVVDDDEYTPDVPMDLILGVTNTSGTSDDWGFSLTVLSGTADAGALTAGPGTTLNFDGGQTYLTHSPKIAGPSPGGVTWAFRWTPSAGDGDAIFYICANAAGQPNGTAGDWIGCDTIRLVEGMTGPMDSDGDGLEDIDEVNMMTNPLDIDSDDDGLSDGEEVLTFMTDPLLCDSDGDGLSDGLELGVDMPIADAGGPLMILGTDVAAGCFVPDADTDSTTDPNLADTDGDDAMIVGCGDGDEDANGNGDVDGDETDPTDPTDCPPVMGPTSRLQLIRDLGAPAASPQAFFNTMPSCTNEEDFRLCDEAGGVHESFDDPMSGISIGGDGVFICIEYDSDLAIGSTSDTLTISKDPVTPGNLIISF